MTEGIINLTYVPIISEIEFQLIESQVISKRVIFKRVQNPVKYIRCTFFAKIVNGCKPLTIFTKSSILDGWQGSENASVIT